MSRPLGPLAAPLGRLYLAAAAARNRLFDAGWLASERVAAPVVCAGNLTAGGSGKTPFVCWLVERWLRRDRLPGVVSRGYGGERDRDPLVVSRGRGAEADAAAAGDEPVLVARRYPEAVVVVGRDRADAARRALRLGAEAIVLDDGFQHRRLERDLDVLLMDWSDPFGGGRGLPAGLLRESPTAIRRAGAVVLTRAPAAMAARAEPLDDAQLPPALVRWLARLDPVLRPPVFAADHRPVRLRLADGSVRPPEALAGARVVAVSGIAHPDAFARTLRALGADLADELSFGDHHRFRAGELRRAHAQAERAGAAFVITTEKDAVRWPPETPPAAVLEVELRVGAAEALLDLVDRRLAAAPGAPAR
jgi:tetraacyldisaccharide 4'-kinase